MASGGFLTAGGRKWSPEFQARSIDAQVPGRPIKEISP